MEEIRYEGYSRSSQTNKQTNWIFFILQTHTRLTLENGLHPEGDVASEVGFLLRRPARIHARVGTAAAATAHLLHRWHRGP